MHPVEENMRKALQHFGILNDQIKEGFHIAPNTKNMRDLTGISVAIDGCEDAGKFQIIIYYDPEFPQIVTTIRKFQ